MNELDDLKLQLTSATGLAWAEPGEDDEQDTFLIARDYVYGEVYAVIEREDSPYRDNRDGQNGIFLRARLITAREVYLPLWRKVQAVMKATGSNVFGTYNEPANIDYPIRQHWLLDPAGFVRMVKFGMTRYRDLYNTDWRMMPNKEGQYPTIEQVENYPKLTHPVLKVQRSTYNELSPDNRKQWMQRQKQEQQNRYAVYRSTFAELLPKFSTLRCETRTCSLISYTENIGSVSLVFDYNVWQLRILYYDTRTSITLALLEAVEDLSLFYNLRHHAEKTEPRIQMDITFAPEQISVLRDALATGRLGSLVKSLYYQIIEKW